MKSFFFEITIGITITSGGIGKKELSTKILKLKYLRAFNNQIQTFFYTDYKTFFGLI